MSSYKQSPLMSPSGDSGLAPLQPARSTHMATTTVKIDGMTCGACTSSVEAAFKGVDGAGAVSVSLVMGRAVVRHDPVRLTAEKVAELIEERGFDAEVLSTDLPSPVFAPKAAAFTFPAVTTTTVSIHGMTCGACTSAVEAGFKDVPGVYGVSVSLLAERAVIQHDVDMISPEAIARIIDDRGFDAQVMESTRQDYRLNTTSLNPTGLETATITIAGMTCGACTSAVEGAVKALPGVNRFNISLLAERAVVTYDVKVLKAEKLAEAIEDAGFEATIVSAVSEEPHFSGDKSTVQLKIYGLPTGEGATLLESSLRSMPGIYSAVVSLSTSRATINYNPSMIGLRAIVDAVELEGYNALVADAEDNNAQLESLAKTREIREWRHAFLYSLTFAVPVFLITMVIPMLFPKSWNFGGIRIIPGLYLGDVLAFILTIPVQFGIGKRFYVSAYKSVKHKSPTMDVLVVMGTSAAFFFSCFAVIIAVVAPPHNKPGTVFDTSTMLICFISLGRWLENRAKGQTSKALSSLMSLAPSMATIYEDPLYAEKLSESPSNLMISPNVDRRSPSPHKRIQSTTRSAVEKIIPTELIEVGDVVILRPGDKIPADGTVIRGESFVDESMVTGEAVPILKQRNSALMAGTVNGAGKLDFKVTRAGKDTQLSQIVNLVQEAQTTRAPIQRMADLVAGYFVPIIILLGLTTFIGWMVLSHLMSHPPHIFTDDQSGGRFMVCLKLCISVIVFACPCALGLATPTAVMVGTGTASQQGILVKGGAALETATRITHVIFDKTGTLTFGKLKVAEIDVGSTWSTDEKKRRLWWLLVGLAESGSEHPIGKSIVNMSHEQLKLGVDEPLPGDVKSFTAEVGQGVSAKVVPDGETVSYDLLIGNAAFFQSREIARPGQPIRINKSGSSPITPVSPLARSSTGTTVVYIAIDGQYAGSLDLTDQLKPTAAAAITALHKMGISTSLVTGDTYNTAINIANLVGISKDSVRSSVSPSEKRQIVAELQEQGEVVAMVGDGINDSPALASANVGIGLVSGSDIAVEAADIVIMRPDDLLNVPTALWLCRIFFRRIKMNLLWACGYNVIGLPFAMGLFLPFGYHMPPLMSATAMIFSSISVTLSSLALRWATRPKWMTVENLEMEAGRVRVPMRGQQKKSTIAAVSKGMFDLFEASVGKRRRPSDAQRGTYVPLQTVEP